MKRQITAIRIISLHGTAKEGIKVAEAITFVEAYDATAAHGPHIKYEVIIRYDHGGKIEAEFQDRGTTIEFLQRYESGNGTPVLDALDDDVE